MPALRASGLVGTHSQPPDSAVLPPNTGCFSTTMTFSPCFFAVMAVARPPAPVPTTSTSQVTFSLSLMSSSVCLNALSARAEDSRDRPDSMIAWTRVLHRLLFDTLDELLTFQSTQ